MPLKKIILIFIGPLFLMAARSTVDSDYLIVGHNTAQIIRYKTSSVYGENYRGNHALDSDPNTSWISAKAAGPHWFQIDFGTKRIMTSIVVYPGRKDNYRTMKYFYLQFLYKGQWFNYEKVEVARKSAGRYKFQDNVTIDLGGIDASTFRIYVPEDATTVGCAAISEIETYIGTTPIQFFDPRLKGLYLPIKNAFLPDRDYNYPNAPRKYRGGRHVGVDLYYYHKDSSYDPIPVTEKTPIYASEGGTILRADWEYESMSPVEWNRQSLYYRNNPDTFVKRSFGGIQVWIDHGNGIVTTYNHLSRIDRSVKKGKRVRRGQRIGWAGNSGLMGDAEGRSYGIHLHFEIWIDGYYLGYGMNMRDIKKYLTWIFFPLQ